MSSEWDDRSKSPNETRQFFTAIGQAVDPQGERPKIGLMLKQFCDDCLVNSGQRGTAEQVRGFLWGLYAAGLLADQALQTLNKELARGMAERWL